MPVNDTRPEAQRVQIAALRKLGPGGRLKAGLDLSQLARDLIRAGIRMRHPDYDERQIDLALFRTVLPPDLFMRAYPWASHQRP
jgi:hypothetical protein